MSQQIFNKHWPLAKNGAGELIPGGAILQTRESKDEPVTLAASMQWNNAMGLFLPTGVDNPLETRARETEAKIEQLRTLLEALGGKDFATQATLAAVLAKLSSDPSTAANQQAAKAVLDTLAGKDYATQTTLAAAVSQLTALVNRLDQTLQVQFPSPQEVTLTGQVTPSVTTTLTTTPLGSGATYTGPSTDCQEHVWPNGGKGVVSVSGLARANVQGTLYLEGSNNGVNWVRVASAAVNNTGVGRLRRTNVFTRYVRMRFVNGSDDQSTFTLDQTLWQVTDGQGDLHGEGEDQFTHLGDIAPNTTVTVMDLRSAIELQDISLHTNESFGTTLRFYVDAYKDDGSIVSLAKGIRTNFSVYNYFWIDGWTNGNVFQNLLEAHPYYHNPENNRFNFRLVRPLTLPKGCRVRLQNGSSTETFQAGVNVTCRLL